MWECLFFLEKNTAIEHTWGIASTFYVSYFSVLTQGITFADFKEFCQFLNNLDDFALALRIYTYADHPISEGKCVLDQGSPTQVSWRATLGICQWPAGRSCERLKQ